MNRNEKFIKHLYEQLTKPDSYQSNELEWLKTNANEKSSVPIYTQQFRNMKSNIGAYSLS